MMEKNFNNLGKWLPPRMEKRGLTAEKLSQMTGISRSSVYNYLIDACRPSTQTMVKICRVLGEPLEAGRTTRGQQEFQGGSDENARGSEN